MNITAHLARVRPRRVLALAFFCSSVVATQVAAQVQTFVPLNTSSGGSLELSLHIGSEAASFLVDTGAAMATINGELFARLSQGRSITGVRQVAARMADGRTRRLSVYRFHDLQLADDCRLESFEAIVVPGKGKNLLGLNVLARFSPISLEVMPPSLGLTGCESLVAATTRPDALSAAPVP